MKWHADFKKKLKTLLNGKPSKDRISTKKLTVSVKFNLILGFKEKASNIQLLMTGHSLL